MSGIAIVLARELKMKLTDAEGLKIMTVGLLTPHTFDNS